MAKRHTKQKVWKPVSPKVFRVATYNFACLHYTNQSNFRIFLAILETVTWEPLIELTRNDPTLNIWHCYGEHYHHLLLSPINEIHITHATGSQESFMPNLLQILNPEFYRSRHQSARHPYLHLLRRWLLTRKPHRSRVTRDTEEFTQCPRLSL